MPKRAAPLHDGEAGLALQHMNNVAKIGGFAKSSYKDQTNIVKFLTDSVPPAAPRWNPSRYEDTCL